MTEASGRGGESSSEEEEVIEESKESELNSWEEDSSSESSEDGGNQSGEETQRKKSVEHDEKPEEKKEEGSNLGGRSSRSDSGSGDSDAKDGEEEEDEDDGPKTRRTRNQPNKDDNEKVWEDNPDVYGIRRSRRARKETSRLGAFKDSGTDDSSDSDNKKKRGKKREQGWIPTLTDSDTDSESSYDVPQRQIPQRKARAGAGRRQQRNRTLSSSSNEYSSKTSRRNKKVQPARTAGRNNTAKVSYKEDSEGSTDSDDLIDNEEDSTLVSVPLEDVETIEKIMRHRDGRKGDTGAQTTIYAVEADELKAKGEPDPAVDEMEVQYLIKWKGWSHLHNTWESEETLIAQRCGGRKKLENYQKKMNEINRWKAHSTPEDVEYFELQVEMSEDIQIQYQKVERIIAHQFTAESMSSYPDYYCKWHGLPYSECSWEDGTLTARFFQNEIDQYLERERSDLIPTKNAKCLKNRPKFVPFKAQPSFVGNESLQLRDYQLDGVNWLVHAWHRETSVILADEMGLGKTIQSISFLSCLFFSHSLYGPFLLVVPLSTLDSWQREFTKWCPDMNVITYIGDVNSRTKLREFEWYLKKTKKIKFNALITTYEILIRDKDILGSLQWAALLVDEAHRLKNDDSLLYRILIDFNTNFRVLITGTPLQNSLRELWCLMHFIMPRTFDDWDAFNASYSISDNDGLSKLHQELEPYLLRRVKKDVEKSLPAKVEQILRVEMSQVQKQLYKLILTKNVVELCRELKGSFSGLLNIIVELKKCCNHSHLIKPHETGFEDENYLKLLINGSGKMILLDKLLGRLKESGHRVLVFSQMVRMLDVIADYLYLKKFQFQRLDGSIKGETRQRALDHFNAEGSQDFCFLLSTRAGGLGINLATADTVIIFDSDWNPQNDLQAMARAHRIGQKKQVSIYRLVTKSTIEEDIIEKAKQKMVLDHLIIQTMDTTGRRVLSDSKRSSSANNPFNKEELSSILKFGAAELFKDNDEDGDQKLEAMDIDEILQRAETQDSDKITSVGQDLLSQFKVVNYAAFEEEEVTGSTTATAASAMEKLWEEIIPEEERNKAIAEMEKEKEDKLVVKQPRNRKAVDNNKATVTTTSTGGKAGKNQSKFKSQELVDTDSSSSSESDGDDDENEEDKIKSDKKSNQKKSVKREGIKGFTDNEIRRFIKSYKKFARPLTRLDSIAEDAELTDKATAELLEVGEILKSSCEQAVKEYQEKLLQDEQFDGKKKGASIKISGVSVNCQSVLKAEVDLEPLAIALPQEKKEQLSFRLTMPTRNVHWGMSWGVVEDSMLLVGMLVYGVGNWDAIKNDPKLQLSSKILPIGNGKPQDKHLQSRADYLLKILKQQCNDQTELVEKEKEKEKPKKKKKTASEQKHEVTKVEKEEKEKSRSREEEKEKKKKSKANVEKTPKKEKKEKKEKKKREPKLKSSATTTTTTATDEKHHIEPSVHVEEVKLDEAAFKKCKEKMRAERKSLQSLQTPDESLNEKEQVQNTKKCLLKIGDHIEKCLDEYNNSPQDLDSWRNNLWSFVAKFTEFGPQKLYKLYRTAWRKRDAVRDEQKKEIQKLKENYSNTLHDMGKMLPADRLEMEEARKRALGMSGSAPAAKIPKLDRIKIPKKETSSSQDNHEHHEDGGEGKSQPTKRDYDQPPAQPQHTQPQYGDPYHHAGEHHGEPPYHGGEGGYGEHHGGDDHGGRGDFHRRKEGWHYNRRGGGHHHDKHWGGGHNRGFGHRGGGGGRYHRDGHRGRDQYPPRGGPHYASGSPPDEGRSGGPGEKVQTYREWKEQHGGGGGVPYDEKPPHHTNEPYHHGNMPRGRGYKERYPDNKHSRMRRNDNGSNTYSDQHRSEWGRGGGGYVDRDDVGGGGGYHSSQPPHVEGGPGAGYPPVGVETGCPQTLMEPWSRKRTYSNNSNESGVPGQQPLQQPPKSHIRDPSQSPNSSNQSWAHSLVSGGGEGNT